MRCVIDFPVLQYKPYTIPSIPRTNLALVRFIPRKQLSFCYYLSLLLNWIVRYSNQKFCFAKQYQNALWSIVHEYDWLSWDKTRIPFSKNLHVEDLSDIKISNRISLPGINNLSDIWRRKARTAMYILLQNAKPGWGVLCKFVGWGEGAGTLRPLPYSRPCLAELCNLSLA